MTEEEFMKITINTNDPNKKFCPECRNVKSITDFQDSANWLICRECNRVRSLRYYHANKEWYKEKIVCEICNVEISRQGYNVHTRSKKHQENESEY